MKSREENRMMRTSIKNKRVQLIGRYLGFIYKWISAQFFELILLFEAYDLVTLNCHFKPDL